MQSYGQGQTIMYWQPEPKVASIHLLVDVVDRN